MEKIPEDIIILQRQKCNGQNVLSFGTIFCPLKLSNNPKNQNPKKNEKKQKQKKTGDNVILHKSTKTYDQIMYSS